jgi:hypothetical protein
MTAVQLGMEIRFEEQLLVSRDCFSSNETGMIFATFTEQGTKSGIWRSADGAALDAINGRSAGWSVLF